jgi:4-diphosphocytidyl-2-C-methyl-D-erythritol kinase
VSSVTVRAPAKVNLQLSVGARRPDGYHDLVNVFQAVSVYDEVTAAASDELTVEVVAVSPGAPSAAADLRGVPLDGTNLAVRAARALAEHAGVPAAAHLSICKAIPVAAGMAGGSADAAAALLACDALWGIHLPQAELMELAAVLGADVPFALLGHTAVGFGRGDQLSPVLGRGQFNWVFAPAEGGLSTAAGYAECDRLRAVGALDPASRADVDPALLAALRAGDAAALGPVLGNDLQPAALSLRPELAATLDAGRTHGALGALVSGSGPTCAFLVADADAGLDLAVALTAMGLCRDVIRAVGPVGGARIHRSSGETP